MQDSNNSQKDDSPIISASMPEVKEGDKHNEHEGRAKSHRKANKPLVFGILAGVAVIGLAAGLIALGINGQSSEQIGEDEYSIKRDPETGERPLFGSDPSKDNSGEAYVKFQQRIINAADSTDAERFDAYVSIAVYYNATENYEKAIETLSKVSANSLSDSQLERYYSVFSAIYESMGDTEKAEEYRKLSENETNQTETQPNEEATSFEGEESSSEPTE